MAKPPVSTSMADIVDYWSQTVEFQGAGYLRSALAFGVEGPDSLRCFVCDRLQGRSVMDRSHLQDHILGGPDAPRNLVPLCRQCNREDMPPCVNQVMGAFWVYRKRIEHLSDIGATLSAITPDGMMAWMERYAAASGMALNSVAMFLSRWVTDIREQMIRNGMDQEEEMMGSLYASIFKLEVEGAS